MKSLTNIILKFLTLLSIVLIVSLFPEMVGGDFELYFRNILGENYLKIVLLIGVITIGTYTFWSEKEKILGGKLTTKTEKTPDQILRKSIINDLLTKYNSRLTNKLATRYPVNLELKYSIEGTTLKAPLYDNKTIRSVKIKEELISIFDRHRGRLLIIGDPGAGKTTLLLQLAIQLLEREETQIPIIINISTWRKRFSSIDEWLSELLPQIGFSKSLVKRLIDQNLLLPLFDGLDELEKNNRKDFFEAVGHFGKNRDSQYVICSRIDEYAITVDAPVFCQIMVKPLTLKQIKASLGEAGVPEAKGILDGIRKSKSFAEVIKTPFYLNTAQILFASMKSWEEIGFKSRSVSEYRREILELFIEESINSYTAFKPKKTMKWLAYLGNQMNFFHLTIFELTSLQYNWVDLSKTELLTAKLLNVIVSKLRWVIILGFSLGFSLWIVGILLSGLTFQSMEGLVFGLIVGVVTGFLAPIQTGLFTLGEIETKGSVGLSFGKLKKGLKKYRIHAVMFIGLAFFSEVLGMVVSWIIFGELFLLKAFKLLFAICTFTGFPIIFSIFISDQLENNDAYLQITRPYQRFRNSGWMLHFSRLQFTFLKKVLWRKDLLPKRLVEFLRESTANDILESDGGSWRFRHGILQEFFANKWRTHFEPKEVKQTPAG